MRYFLAALCGLLASAIVNAQTIAEKITTLSLDKTVNSSSTEVKRMQAALTRNAKVCDFESEEKLANVAWYITKKVRSEGHHAEATEIIEGANAVLLGAKARLNCTDLLSTYALSRIDGNTHSDAVAGARALYRMSGLVK